MRGFVLAAAVAGGGRYSGRAVLQGTRLRVPCGRPGPGSAAMATRVDGRQTAVSGRQP
jgi:hypothetical protein